MMATADIWAAPLSGFSSLVRERERKRPNKVKQSFSQLEGGGITSNWAAGHAPDSLIRFER